MERQRLSRQTKAPGQNVQKPVGKTAAEVPNSHMTGLFLKHDAPDPDLADAMQSRMRQVVEDQIPGAEREADELAQGVGGSTPEGIKADLGERMGADFSDVRFHMGPDAAQRAASMGARAYTEGRDVYFGEGGFEPDVAAHELVHTAQQGVVESGMATESVAAGTVQMLSVLNYLSRKWHGFRRNRMIGSIESELHDVVDPRTDFAFDPTAESAARRKPDSQNKPPAERQYAISVDPEAPLGGTVPAAFEPGRASQQIKGRLQAMALVHEGTHVAADMQYASNRSGERQFQLSAEENPSDATMEGLETRQSADAIGLIDLLQGDASIPEDVRALFEKRLERAGGSPGEWDSVMNELVVGTREFGVEANNPFAIAIRKRAEQAMALRRRGRR